MYSLYINKSLFAGIQKIFPKYKVLPYESTLSRTKYAVRLAFEKACT